MWFFIRLSLVCMVFIFLYGTRSKKRRSKVQLPDFPEGQNYRLVHPRTRRGGVFCTELHLSFRPQIYFRLLNESRLTRVFKHLGLSREFQSGDPEFDRLVYIASDHNDLHRLIREEPEFRSSVLELKRDWAEIKADGLGTVVLSTPQELSPPPEKILRHSQVIARMESLFPAKLTKDLHYSRYALHSVLLAYPLGFFLGSVLEFVFGPDVPRLIEPWSLFPAGLGLGVVLFVIWVISVVGSFRKSSYGPLVFKESYAFALILLALAGPQLCVDLNSVLDSSRPKILQAYVENRGYEDHRKRPRSYYLVLRFDQNPYNLPPRFGVSNANYRRFPEGSRVQLEVKEGAFNTPYFAGIYRVPKADL